MPAMHFQDHIIGTGSHNLNCEIKIDGQIEKYQLLNSQLMMIPAKHTFNIKFDKPHVSKALHLSHKLLKRNALELWDIDKFELIRFNNIEDPLMTNIYKSLSMELKKKSDGCEIYAQTMVNALVVHLLSRYSNHTKPIKTYTGGLSPKGLKLVIEFIQDNLDQNLTVANLANLVQLSQYHFARAFKQSLGISPHQYILQQRIEKSKHLLKQKSITINEISVSCGFSNPSHFAKCFRQKMGISPKEFRMMVEF